MTRLTSGTWSYPRAGIFSAVAGSYQRAIGSVKRGTLKLETTAKGLQVELTGDALATPAGRELVEMSAAVPLYARPIFIQELSAYTEVGDVAVYQRMAVKAILIGSTDHNAGWPELEFGEQRRDAKPEPVTQPKEGAAMATVVPFPADTAGVAQFNALRYLVETSGSKLESRHLPPLTISARSGLAWQRPQPGESSARRPARPDYVKDEAAVRYFGYLSYSGSSGGGGYGAIRSSTIGPSTEQFVVNHQRAWINSGAKSMLSPWKPLRAAVIRNEVEA